MTHPTTLALARPTRYVCFWDVAPDGRFLMLKRAGAESQTVVVHNWGAELREKTAAKK